MVAFILFAIWEITDNHPIVDVRVLRHRGFAVSAVAMFFAFGAFFASLILLPLWLQLGMGYTATTAGYVLAQQGMLGVLAAPLAAYLTKKLDSRILMSGGLAHPGWRDLLPVISSPQQSGWINCGCRSLPSAWRCRFSLFLS